MKRGFFRIWVVVSVLWVGLVGLSWQEQFVWSIENKCWASTYAWTTAPPNVDDLNKNDWNGPKPNDNECYFMGEYPIDFLPKAIAHAVSLPSATLIIWFVGGWVVRGFRRAEPRRPA